MRPVFDERDAIILARKQIAFDTSVGPRSGDVVEFANGIVRRVSHIWPDEADPDLQTSDGGSWYLGDGYMSFSGTLHRSVRASTLTDTGETREMPAWFFHHDFHQAHSGVEVMVRVRVYRCNVEAPS
jgi:hypothetical protein